MTGRIVVAYDGSDASRRAVDAAIRRANTDENTILIVYVIEWSPYSFLSNEELAIRHKRRNEELAQADEMIIRPLLADLDNPATIKIESLVRYGHVAEILRDVIRSTQATEIYLGKTGRSSVLTRVFGSVVSTFVQITPVPCTIVP